MSEDQTVKVAEAYGARVIPYAEDVEYEQRNLYIEEARGEWLVIIDGDERIDADSFNQEFQEQIAQSNRAGFYIPIINFYGEGKWASTTTLRLYKNVPGLQYDKAE